MEGPIMKHVGQSGNGGPEVLTIAESPLPKLKKDEVLLLLVATALNRAETLQRQGNYPIPPGATHIIGLEGSGYICDEKGVPDLSRPVMALLSGGGYAQYVAVHKNHVMDVPKSVSVRDGTAIPEVWLTAYLLLRIAQTQENDWVLLYGGASGVGTAAIQIVKKHYKGRVLALAGTTEKCQVALALGADAAVNYKTEDSAARIQEITEKKGCNVILDCIGAQNFELSMKSIALDGRWVVYGWMGGTVLEKVNIASLLRSRATITFSTLRSRTDEFKTELVEQFKKLLPLFDTGDLKICVDSRYEVDWTDAKVWQDAHRKMENNENIGKIILNLANPLIKE